MVFVLRLATGVLGEGDLDALPGATVVQPQGGVLGCFASRHGKAMQNLPVPALGI